MANIIPSEFLLDLYQKGHFPMADEHGDIRIFSPDPRGIIPLDQFHIPHGLKRALKDPLWEIRVDTAFEEVLLACAEREQTWIDETIFLTYATLHRRGNAHSVEVWRDGLLAGGLYGVRIGAAFFGESMFHRVRDASKIALVGLVERLRAGGFQLLDTQWITPHLAQFGAVEISKRAYLTRLKKAVSGTADWGSV